MLLIRGGKIKPIVGEEMENGELLIGDDGKIAAIGQKEDAPEGVEVLDASGCLVTPGFIDAHCHIGIDEEGVRWEGNDTNEYSSPVTPELRAIDGINPRCEAFANALAGGVTTAVTGPGSANVLGGSFVALKLYGDCVDDMVVKYPAAMKIAFGENPKGCYGQNGKKEPVTRMAIAAMLRAAGTVAAFLGDRLIASGALGGIRLKYESVWEGLLLCGGLSLMLIGAWLTASLI